MTDQRWIDFLVARGLIGEVGEENLLPCSSRSTAWPTGRRIYERGGLLHARKIALVVVDELARASLPADGGRPRP